MARLRYLQNKRSGTAGTIVKSTSKLHFFDDDMYIYASADGVLEIVSNTSITLTAPTVNVASSTVSAYTYPVTIDFACTAASVSCLTITSSSADTTGGTTVIKPLYVDATMSATGGLGRAIEGKLTVSGKLGSYGNAIKGYTDLTGGTGTSGLASAVCAEMKMSAGATLGTFGVLEIELVCPASWTAGGGTGTNCTSLIYAQTSGDTAASQFDTYGYFLNLQGVTDDTGHLFTESTLRSVVGSTNYYVPLLTAQVDINDPSSKYVIYVNEDTGVASGTQDGTFHRPYDEIQDAVLKVIANEDNTDSIPYTIMVGPGTYTTTIDLDSTYLYNLSIIAIGGPHSVIVNVGSNALECNASNDHLHYLYVKGIDFYDPINFLGADSATNFLSEECIFEDCLLSNGGSGGSHTPATMLTLVNVGRFFWKNGSIHVLDSLTFTNVKSCGISGESYRDIFDLTGAPGTTALIRTTGNKPVDLTDDGSMNYYIQSAYVQRKEPDFTTGAATRKIRYWLRNSYCGLGMGLSVPQYGHLYAHNSVFPGNVTLASGSVAKLYKSHIRGTFTDSGADLAIYGSSEGTGLTVAA